MQIGNCSNGCHVIFEKIDAQEDKLRETIDCLSYYYLLTKEIGLLLADEYTANGKM